MTFISDLPRIRWACRRGMLELDLMLLPFLEFRYSSLTVEERQAFLSLLNCNDQELYQWLLGKGVVNDPALIDIVRLIREYFAAKHVITKV